MRFKYSKVLLLAVSALAMLLVFGSGGSLHGMAMPAQAIVQATQELTAGDGQTAQTTQAATLAATSATGVPALFDGQAAYKDVKAQVDFGFRPTGSAASIQTGDYIIAQLKAAGWKASEQPFDISVNGSMIKARNIIGSIGSGPVVIIGAHYDTRLWANQDPDPNKRFDPVMGADDAGSGVGVMLELARVIGQNYHFNRELRLVFLDAEDNGEIPGWDKWSIGTYYYVDHLDVKPDYVIILDMVGDNMLDCYYEAESMRSDPDLMTGIWNVAASLGYSDNFIPKVKWDMIDDHTPFIEKGYKAIDIIDFDYPYWHTTSDTLDKVSADSLQKVGRVIQKYLEQSGAIKADSPS